MPNITSHLFELHREHHPFPANSTISFKSRITSPPVFLSLRLSLEKLALSCLKYYSLFELSFNDCAYSLICFSYLSIAWII